MEFLLNSIIFITAHFFIFVLLIWAINDFSDEEKDNEKEN
jgi:hypothetical protein